jgi:hypothetical protein
MALKTKPLFGIFKFNNYPSKNTNPNLNLTLIIHKKELYKIIIKRKMPRVRRNTRRNKRKRSRGWFGRSRSPKNRSRSQKIVERTETRERRRGEINLWEEEWNTCAPSGPDCYYYIWNFTHDNYYCPEEKDLLARGVYSKYEIDDFLKELQHSDLHRVDKNPTGWYYCLSAFAVLGIALIFTALYLYYNLLNDKFKWFWIILGVFIFILASVLMCCGCYYCCRPRHRYLRRRDDMMPVVDAENRRVYHRGLNWRMSELGSYIALRTNFNGPVGGYRRRNPLEEEALLMGKDKHHHVPKRDHTRVTKDTKTTTISKAPVATTRRSVISSRSPRTSIVEESRVVSPARSSVVSERVVEVRNSAMEVNDVYRSNQYDTEYQGGY